jgi:hypothetical protein
MRQSEIRKLFASEEEMNYGSPVHQDSVFIIMWQSTKSGGTYTALRKSIRGKNKFLSGLRFLGVDLKEVQVIEQTKTWVPVPKSQMKGLIKQ